LNPPPVVSKSSVATSVFSYPPSSNYLFSTLAAINFSHLADKAIAMLYGISMNNDKILRRAELTYLTTGNKIPRVIIKVIADIRNKIIIVLNSPYALSNKSST